MTSSELFLCTPKAALENDSSFVLTLKEQVGFLTGWSNLCNKRARVRGDSVHGCARGSVRGDTRVYVD